MAITDMYELVHNMTYLGQTILNVYHAEKFIPAETAESVQEAWQNSVLGALQGLQNTFVINNSVSIFNLGTSTDFTTVTLTGAPGFRAGNRSPVFVSAGIRYPSLDRDIRSGHKRYSGMLEADYTDGVVIAAVLTLMTAINTALLGDWLASSDSRHVANFVIIGRVCKTTDPVTGKCLVYRLPETDVELKFYTPTSALNDTEISSQVSRKKQ